MLVRVALLLRAGLRENGRMKRVEVECVGSHRRLLVTFAPCSWSLSSRSETETMEASD